MTESLITMQCNSSGWSSPTRGSKFGIVSYDWSNMKRQWAQHKPMTCEEHLLQQALLTKQLQSRSNNQHIFVYRNIVKALPWFRSVREKLDDPAYEGFFLPFATTTANHPHVPPCAAENATHCSHLYHDQEQTPQVPTATNPHPDGSCGTDYCDCGVHPCGEYLFDHRNGTQLREFLVNEVVLDALVPGLIDGLFLDDYWCSDIICQESNQTVAGCPCADPVQGPTEIDVYSQTDTGLTDENIRDITVEWNKTMTAVQKALLAHGAYTWSLMPYQENANAQPLLLSADNCDSLLRDACRVDSLWQRLPLLFGFTVDDKDHELPQLDQDMAFFLLARGPYAWAGWGAWGMTWPFGQEPAHGALPPLPDGVPLPNSVFLDYGHPLDVCHESGTGVFTRRWSKASIELDCSRFEAKVELFESFVAFT